MLASWILLFRMFEIYDHMLLKDARGRLDISSLPKGI